MMMSVCMWPDWSTWINQPSYRWSLPLFCMITWWRSQYRNVVIKVLSFASKLNSVQEFYEFNEIGKASFINLHNENIHINEALLWTSNIINQMLTNHQLSNVAPVPSSRYHQKLSGGVSQITESVLDIFAVQLIITDCTNIQNLYI